MVLDGDRVGSVETYSHRSAGSAVVHWLTPEAVLAPPTAHQTLYTQSAYKSMDGKEKVAIASIHKLKKEKREKTMQTI